MVYYAYVQSLLTFGIIAWGGCFKSTLEPLNVSQKLILKTAFGKCKRYPSDALFLETSVLTVRQLFVKSLLVHIFNNVNNIFHGISHSHNTRYSSKVGVISLQILKTFSLSNSFYISHILYRNICNNFQDLNLFNSPSSSIFKKRVNDLLLSLGKDEAEIIIAADYRRVWVWPWAPPWLDRCTVRRPTYFRPPLLSAHPPFPLACLSQCCHLSITLLMSYAIYFFFLFFN